MNDKEGNEMISSRKEPSIISVLSCGLLLLIMITPVLKVQLAGRYLSLVGALLLCIWGMDVSYVTLREKKIDVFSLLTILYLGFIVLVLLLNDYNVRSSAIAIFLPLFPIVCFSHYRRYVEKKRVVVLCCILGLALIVTFISTISMFEKSQYIIRDIAHETYEVQSVYAWMNVGNTGHVYSAAIYLIFIISNIKKVMQCKLLYKIVFIASGIVSLLLVLQGSSGISIIVSTIGIIFSTIQNKKSTTKFLIGLLSIIIIPIAIPLVSSGLRVIASSIDNIYISDKMIDLSTSISEFSAVGDVYARISRYALDLETFGNHFLFGVGSQYGQAYSSAIVDGHSDLFGNLARYGIIWGIFVVIYFNMYSRQIKRFTETEKNDHSIFSVSIAFVLMVVLQPVLTSIEVLTTYFLVVPVGSFLLNDKKSFVH